MMIRSSCAVPAPCSRDFASHHTCKRRGLLDLGKSAFRFIFSSALRILKITRQASSKYCKWSKVLYIKSKQRQFHSGTFELKTYIISFKHLCAMILRHNLSTKQELDKCFFIEEIFNPLRFIASNMKYYVQIRV